jgi:hypothetical protein
MLRRACGEQHADISASIRRGVKDLLLVVVELLSSAASREWRPLSSEPGEPACGHLLGSGKLP